MHDALPPELVNDPGSQFTHAVAPADDWNRPAVHWVQVALPGELDTEPGLQSVHEVCPLNDWNCPAVQLLHEVWAVASLKPPGLQARHVVWPTEGWYCPMSQGVQGASPVGLEVPGTQLCAAAGCTEKRTKPSARTAMRRVGCAIGFSPPGCRAVGRRDDSAGYHAMRPSLQLKSS